MTGDIGKVYASALFEISIENNSLKQNYTELNEFNNIFNQNTEFIKLLSSPGLTIDEKLEVLNNVFHEESRIYNFICLITEKGRISYLDKITIEFNNMYNEYNNIIEIEVISSILLSDKQKEKLMLKLEEKSGKKVKLIEKIDESIIGGLIIKYGNSQIDYSIKGKLEAVSKQLNIE